MRILIFLIAILLATTGCEDGDWLGPMERGMRAAFDGWDMWATDAVRPYEDPMPSTVPGTIPTDGIVSFETAQKQAQSMSPGDSQMRADLVYRRFCHHCHGPNGDGRIIVGESLDIAPKDLGSLTVQRKSDKQLFQHLETGGRLMVPLLETMSKEDMILVIGKIRSLKGSASRPYFKTQFDTPLEPK